MTCKVCSERESALASLRVFRVIECKVFFPSRQPRATLPPLVEGVCEWVGFTLHTPWTPCLLWSRVYVCGWVLHLIHLGHLASSGSVGLTPYTHWTPCLIGCVGPYTLYTLDTLPHWVFGSLHLIHHVHLASIVIHLHKAHGNTVNNALIPLEPGVPNMAHFTNTGLV